MVENEIIGWIFVFILGVIIFKVLESQRRSFFNKYSPVEMELSTRLWEYYNASEMIKELPFDMGFDARAKRQALCTLRDNARVQIEKLREIHLGK